MDDSTKQRGYRQGRGLQAQPPVPLPLFVLRPVFAHVIAELFRHHPGLFERLGPYRDRRFLLDPIDMPAVLLLRPDPHCPTLEACNRNDVPAFDAAISGPLARLIELASGAKDGDALFFSRDLVIEGDTEAVLALRNAIDDLEIDLLDEIENVLGPVGLLLRFLRRRVEGIGGWAGRGSQ